eukprot:CAMPEP_0181368242 /NCGR_PEP_ID=MMETSP1106-20121128/11957_1 /TAXON_ID=81844 /ORGANISM="Mantoniella antarctica, Strain SL-175" /LENGTH=404 /DNA_ID=CAMNT_0023484293 /DNA_START=66 /DNA_END=1280 /DNA_ORIENTATION=+
MGDNEERNLLLMGGGATGQGAPHGRTEKRSSLYVGLCAVATATLGLACVCFAAAANSHAVGGGLRMRPLAKEGSARRVSALHPPEGFEGWKGAPIWNDVDEIPVLFTKGAIEADFVVVGHSTDLTKDKYFLASLHKHGIHAALAGNGTGWHWFEDKLIGAKAALLQIPGNPVVMFADTTDVMFSCPEEEILARFERTGADILLGGESQLWPEIETYFDMTDELAYIDETAAGIDVNIGLREGAEEASPGDNRRPNKWANGGTWMGRKDDLLDYYKTLEGYLVNNAKEQGDGDGFRRACRPYKMTASEYRTHTVAAGYFDDQTCLNRFMMESAGAKHRNARVKVDMDGTMMLSVGGAGLEEFKEAAGGKVYWERTQKVPCVWHFNNPNSKKLMPLIAKKFPSYWV